MASLHLASPPLSLPVSPSLPGLSHCQVPWCFASPPDPTLNPATLSPRHPMPLPSWSCLNCCFSFSHQTAELSLASFTPHPAPPALPHMCLSHHPAAALPSAHSTGVPSQPGVSHGTALPGVSLFWSRGSRSGCPYDHTTSALPRLQHRDPGCAPQPVSPSLLRSFALVSASHTLTCSFLGHSTVTTNVLGEESACFLCVLCVLG